MKNFYSIFSLSVASLALCSTAQAQISNGGLPLSIQNGNLELGSRLHIYENPVSEESIAALNSDTTKMSTYVALFADTDIQFPGSGEFHYTADGSIIWKTQFKVSDAPAIGLYFDKFVLPKGVNMFVSNANGKQILGAYSIENNSTEDTKFATEAVQGNTVNIELNISPNVNINDIQLNMDKAAVYFASISYLAKYVSDDVLIGRDEYGLEGSSSSCMIEAKCESDHFAIALDASLQTLYVAGRGLSMCSASMINSLGNTTATNCKQYVLTASHCQSNGSGIGDTTNTAFSQTLFRYNFQKTTCTSTTDALVETLTGASFRARSPYDGNRPIADMEGDFLLVELRSRPPENWGTKLAGWDIGGQLDYSVNSTERYVGFHHPAGDIKKTSWTKELSRTGQFFTQQFPANASQGGIARGSSGSSLFNNNNRIIGIASTAGDDDPTCGGGFGNPNLPDFLLRINYYRISHAWEFAPSPTQQLKVWLDPANTGARTMPAVTTLCNAVAGQGGGNSIKGTSDEFTNAINVYPNPSTGMLNVSMKLNNAKDISIDVYNALGSKVNSYNIANAQSVTQSIDLSHLNSGVYLVKFYDGTNVATKKVTITK